MERQIATALKAATPKRTPNCLEPDDLLLLIDQGEADPRCAPMLAHVATCPYCRREYVQMRKDLMEAAELRAAARIEQRPTPTESITSPALSKPSWWEAWRRRLFSFPALGYAWTPAAALILAYLLLVRPTQIAEHTLKSRYNALLAQYQDLKQHAPQTIVGTGPSESERRLREQLKAKADRLARVEQVNQRVMQENQRAVQQNHGLQIARDDAQRQANAASRALQQARLALNNPNRGPWTSEEIASIRPSQMFDEMRTMGGPHENDGESIHLLSPVRTVIQEDRPLLRWLPFDGATSYQVSIYRARIDQGTLFPEGSPLVTSLPMSGTQYQVPITLPRGKVYEWQVDAQKNGKPVLRTDGKAVQTNRWFLVMEQPKAVTLAQKLTPLKLRVIDLEIAAGLVEQARQELQAIPRTDPLYPEAQKRLQKL